MSTLGDDAFLKVAMRPGRPLAFGRIWSGGSAGAGSSALLFGLPGNPVAVMVTFYHFVRTALLTMMGAAPQPLPLIKASSSCPISKRAGRTEYQRGIARRTPEGLWQVALTGAQGSGVLSSMSDANCFVMLGHDEMAVPFGGLVDILLFDSIV
jgi:molybdopterin molybdotransferase